MSVRPGSILVIPSRRVGVPEQRGVIEEVTEHPGARPNFRVRWSDGRVSSFQPAGAYRIESRAGKTRH